MNSSPLPSAKILTRGFPYVAQQGFDVRHAKIIINGLTNGAYIDILV